jgi:hypothetical protein
MQMRRTSAIPAALLLALVCSAKEREFAMPRASHAKTYPAHDAHEGEKFSIAADPYETREKAVVFTVNYHKEKLLPIHMIFSNDGDAAVVLTDMNVKLITKNRVRMEPLNADDIYRRIAKQKRRGDEPPIQLPVPLPRRAPRSISNRTMNEVQSMQFMAKAVEPQATQAGFFTFDVSDIANPLSGAMLEITGVRDQNGQELFYFEIPLDKYLNAPARSID